MTLLLDGLLIFAAYFAVAIPLAAWLCKICAHPTIDMRERE